MAGCELNQIFLGEIASVQNYGAFVRIPSCKQQGLIHKSQVSSARVEDVADVLQRGDRIWCKVINIGDDGKIGLSMKHVDQGNGKDLDPNGVEQQQDEQRRKKLGPGQKKAIELQAVLNTTCGKCGTRGHLSNDCFMTPDGKKYDLLPEIEESSVGFTTLEERMEAATPRAEDKAAKEEKRSKSKKLKKRKKSKKSRQRSDGGSDDEDDDDEESGERKRKRRKKKRSKESKKRKRKHSESESDSDSSEGAAGREAKRRESNDKKSKKCKHSRSKHSD